MALAAGAFREICHDNSDSILLPCAFCNPVAAGGRGYGDRQGGGFATKTPETGSLSRLCLIRALPQCIIPKTNKEKPSVQNDTAFRLAKPKKKGLLPLIFSRFLVIALLLALQIVASMTFYIWLDSYLPWFSAARVLFTLAMIVYLFNSGMDPTAKLTWMFLIAVLPLPAAAFLCFTQTNTVYRKLAKRVTAQIRVTKCAIRQKQSVLEELKSGGSGTNDLCRYLNRTGCFPVFDNTQAVYFPIGEKMFDAMLAELKKAEKYIFMEYFIIEEGYMWGEILKILIEKAKAGIDVRVMYDGMCEVTTLPASYWKLLEKQGIRSRSFSPIRPVLSTHYNYRDHRKILAIDGKAAFSGGVNLADEYINRVERFGHWKDTGVMVKGDAAASFTLMFLQMWSLNDKDPVIEPYCRPQPYVPEKPSGYVMPYADCPLDEYKAGEAVYIDILSRADRYVHIMTPYLILDGEVEAALKYAAQRGVDVKLILPGIPDKKAAYALAKAHYRALTGAGVRIFEYTPGFVHAKVFVSDGCKAVVGTINLDYRSLYHHFECAAYLYGADCIADIEKDFQDTLGKCREVTADTIKKEKMSYKIAGELMRFLAPLM